MVSRKGKNIAEGGGGRRAPQRLELRLFRQRLRQYQNRLRKNSLFVIPNGVCGVRNLLFPWHFAKSRSLASLGMTTNCDSSAACTSRALPKIASGVRVRRPRECGASGSEESKPRGWREAEGKSRAAELSQKGALDNQVAAADRMARKVWGGDGWPQQRIGSRGEKPGPVPGLDGGSRSFHGHMHWRGFVFRPYRSSREEHWVDVHTRRHERSRQEFLIRLLR
jgi:hypothetical protein